MSTAHSPLLRVPCIAEATTSQSACFLLWSEHSIYSRGSDSTLRTPFVLHSVWTDIYEREELGVISHPALSKATLSARPLNSMRTVHSRSLSEAEILLNPLCAGYDRLVPSSIVALPKRFLTSPKCRSDDSASYLNRNAHCRLQAVPKPEMTVVNDTKDGDEEAVVYGDLQRFKQRSPK